MKFIVKLFRLLVGVLFIISGLIKLNDPLGFSFKLEEYFSETVFNLPFLQEYALPIALVVVITEVVLGVMLLLGYKKKFTLYALFLMIIAFTFLTFYSAYYNKVTDCGCFGDAIKLTPWQSFSKDVILLVMITLLILGIKHIQLLFKYEISAFGVSLFSLIACSVMGWYVLNHLPLVDFRAYAVKTNIPEGMQVPDDAEKSEYDIKFTYNVNGVDEVYGMEELNALPENATYVSREEQLIKKGYEPPIHDFSIEKEGGDFTEDIFNQPKVLIITSYTLEKFNAKSVSNLKKIVKIALAKGYEVIGLTSSAEEKINEVQSKYKLPFEFYFCDGTTIKTIVRSNPGLMQLEYGIIKDKKHWNDASSLKL